MNKDKEMDKQEFNKLMAEIEGIPFKVLPNYNNDIIIISNKNITIDKSVRFIEVPYEWNGYEHYDPYTNMNQLMLLVFKYGIRVTPVMYNSVDGVSGWEIDTLHDIHMDDFKRTDPVQGIRECLIAIATEKDNA